MPLRHDFPEPFNSIRSLSIAFAGGIMCVYLRDGLRGDAKEYFEKTARSHVR